MIPIRFTRTAPSSTQTGRGSSLIIENADVLFGEAQFEFDARMPNFPSIDDSVMNLQIEGPDIERLRYVLRLPGVATGAFSLDFTIDVIDDEVCYKTTRIFQLHEEQGHNVFSQRRLTHTGPDTRLHLHSDAAGPGRPTLRPHGRDSHHRHPRDRWDGQRSR